MEKITSTQNPLIRRLKALKDAKGRNETGLFLVEGEIMIREALKCGLTPEEALFEADSDYRCHREMILLWNLSLKARKTWFRAH